MNRNPLPNRRPVTVEDNRPRRWSDVNPLAPAMIALNRNRRQVAAAIQRFDDLLADLERKRRP